MNGTGSSSVSADGVAGDAATCEDGEGEEDGDDSGDGDSDPDSDPADGDVVGVTVYPGDDKPFVELAAPGRLHAQPPDRRDHRAGRAHQEPVPHRLPDALLDLGRRLGHPDHRAERHQRRHHRHQRQVHGLHPAVAHRRQRCRAPGHQAHRLQDERWRRKDRR